MGKDNIEVTFSLVSDFTSRLAINPAKLTGPDRYSDDYVEMMDARDQRTRCECVNSLWMRNISTRYVPHCTHISAAADPLHDGWPVVWISTCEQNLAQGVGVEQNGVVQISGLCSNL